MDAFHRKALLIMTALVLIGLVILRYAVWSYNTPHVSTPGGLAKHWVCADGSPHSGMLLRSDGWGELTGRELTAPGPPVEWYVEGQDTLRVRHFGEEGEHGDFETIKYTLQGNRLRLSKVVDGCREFVLKQLSYLAE